MLAKWCGRGFNFPYLPPPLPLPRAQRLHGHGRLLVLRGQGRRAFSRSGLVVLGIETSCDDTCASVVSGEGAVLSDERVCQLPAHQPYGGVVPYLAHMLHGKYLGQVVQKALERSGQDWQSLSAIAVTQGPGLALCLGVGLTFAIDASRTASKPLIGVHHMEAHALTVRLKDRIPFPYLVLLVSGGHCLLAVVWGPGSVSRLGSTLDDSPGEALDKVSVMLRLSKHPGVSQLPGGAAIEQLAREGDPTRFPMPVSIMGSKPDCDFSFAGIKTRMKRIIGAHDRGQSQDEPVRDCQHLAATFEDAVFRHLVTRVQRAILFCKQWAPSVSHLVVSGGVASNGTLRRRLGELVASRGYTLHCPPRELCTDNGVMIAWTAIEHLNAGKDAFVKDVGSMIYYPAWPLGSDVSRLVKDSHLTTRKMRDLSQPAALHGNGP